MLLGIVWIMSFWTEKSHSEADIRSTSREIPRLLCNQKVHYCVYKSPLLVPILNQLNTACALFLLDPI
jgi:hypothetical protein